MNQASSSRGPSAAKAKVVGIPSACWCGALIATLLSKTPANPFRRFYRCSYAISEKLVDDNHVFKWVDAALVEEVEKLQNSIDRVENEVVDHLQETLMDLAENFVMDKLEYLLINKAEAVVKDRVEHAVKEKLDELVKDRVEHAVKEKVEQLVLEKVEKLVMEMVQAKKLMCIVVFCCVLLSMCFVY